MMDLSPRPQQTSGLASEDGFILPVALAVLVLLSMITATGIYSARHDLWAAAATRHAAVALAAADAGASRTLATWSQSGGPLPLPGDSIVIDWQDLPDGSQYRTVLYRPPVGGAQTAVPRVVLFTTGRARPPVQGRRTVVTIVEATSSSIPCCDGATKVSSRLRVSGRIQNDPIPEVDGTDRNPPGWSSSVCTAPLQDVPGAVSSDASSIELRNRGDIDGSPPVREDPTIDPGDFTDFGGTTYDDMAALADIRFSRNQKFDKNEIGPVVVGGQCDTQIDTNWGSPLDPGGACGGHAPTIHVAGNLDLKEGQGQGLLLVDGDLKIQDDFVFFGLIIVLGTLDVSRNGRIYGAVLVRGDQNGRGRSEVSDEGKILYSSCAVQQAQSGLGGTTLAPGRSWFEVVG